MRGEYFVDFIARNPEAGLSETGEGFAKFGGAGEVQATSAAVLGSSIFFSRPQYDGLSALGLCEGGTHRPFARREKGGERFHRAH
jgi:hypothetical protein